MHISRIIYVRRFPLYIYIQRFENKTIKAFVLHFSSLILFNPNFIIFYTIYSNVIILIQCDIGHALKQIRSEVSRHSLIIRDDVIKRYAKIIGVSIY